MRVNITGRDKLEVVKRCIDLEKRGYECIAPIKKYKRSDEVTGNDNYDKKYRFYNDMNTKYIAVYDKVSGQ